MTQPLAIALRRPPNCRFFSAAPPMARQVADLATQSRTRISRRKADNNYPAGTVAMAEPSGGEAGSQFFLVYEDSTLPPGLHDRRRNHRRPRCPRAIGKDGTSNGTSDGPPIKPITIETFTVDQA